MLVYFIVFLRFSIGIIFFVSFIGKALNLSTFYETINQFRLLPKHFSKPAGLLFAIGELFTLLLMLLGGKWLLPGLSLSFILLLIFTVGLVSVLMRKLDITCNCFGPSQNRISIIDLLRNSGLILLTIIGIAITLLEYEGTAVTRSLSAVEVSAIGAMAGIFIITLNTIGGIIRLFREW